MSQKQIKVKLGMRRFPPSFNPTYVVVSLTNSISIECADCEFIVGDSMNAEQAKLVCADKKYDVSVTQLEQ